MLNTLVDFEITWEKLPDDFVLSHEPVDNINQPSLAAALTDSLQVANLLPAEAIVFTNYGICATINGQIVVKAPDWGFVSAIRVPRAEVNRSYTPHLQGEIPTIVMEFAFDTKEEEYSIKPTYPPGKYFFYGHVLRVPNYAIFSPISGVLEFYRLEDSGRYQLQEPDENERYWIPEINLFLGVWSGMRENRTDFWLRWWNEQNVLLLWGSELAEQERQRAERLAAQLRAAGIEPTI